MSHAFLRSLFIILFGLSLVQNLHAQLSNPNIGLNGLLQAKWGDHSILTQESSNGFSLQELELQMSSNIDHYFRGQVVLGVEKEEREYIIEPEEAYLETLNLPSFSIRAGKFLASVGRHNELHTHAFPFIDPPLANTYILGGDGLNESGLSVAYLLPTPWFSEILVQVFSAENENLFGSETDEDVAVFGGFKNFIEWNEDLGLESRLTYGTGENSFGGRSHLLSASIFIKWRPAHISDRTISWTMEYMFTDREKAPTDRSLAGLSTWMQAQWTKRWWVQARAENWGLARDQRDSAIKYSVLVGFVPTEFSALRAQYDHLTSKDEEDHRIILQLSFSMGAHPAHNY